MSQDWQQVLSPEQFQVCRCAVTEAPFSGQYWNHKEIGTYTCAACGQSLYVSEHKYDSGTGWPSFFDHIGALQEVIDHSYGMVRTEIRCAQCESHLGHLFDDGPEPTGKRFCINSLALNFFAA